LKAQSYTSFAKFTSKFRFCFSSLYANVLLMTFRGIFGTWEKEMSVSFVKKSKNTDIFAEKER
jgi:hypothetical protein